MVSRELLEEFIPFWNHITAQDQATIEQKTEKRQVKKGTIIHNGDRDCLGLLVVIGGGLRAYTISEEGKAITLYRLLERDMCMLAASCIMSNIEFEIVIEAREDAELLIVPVKVYEELTNRILAVSQYTNQLISARFSDVMWVMDQILNKSFDARLAGFLVEESSLNDSPVLEMTHEDIAQYLGTAREVVTRMLKYFQTEDWVSISRGRITVTDYKGLEKIAGNSIR